MGRSTTLRTQDAGPMRTVTLTDPVGRTVATQYRQRDGEWTLTGWVDPRGLETRVGTYGGRMDVTAPGGRVYRLEVKVDGTVQASRCLRAIAGSGSAAPRRCSASSIPRVESLAERDKAMGRHRVALRAVMRVGRDAAGQSPASRGPRERSHSSWGWRRRHPIRGGSARQHRVHRAL